MHFIKRYFQSPEQSFFLFGPRGTGKSTLMRKLYADALWVDLLKPDVLRSFSARPERLYELVKAQVDQRVIVIDEVQKVPSLLSVIHGLIEEKLDKQFILSGSSARKLKRTGADLMAGRALKRTLHPFMASELGPKAFSLQEALLNGMLPLVKESVNPHDTIQSYVGLYLQEEIQSEGLVRNIENFSRFLEIVSFSHSSLLNITNIAREAEIKRKTVENYIEILEDLLLAYRLPVFTRRAQRALVSHSKFYLFDAGVYSVLRPKGPFDRPEEFEGAALEGLVMQHLHAWNDYSTEKHELAFWRTRGGVEVDFVIYGEKGLWGIEVKNSDSIAPKDTKGLEAFMLDYPIAKTLLLYRGKERLLQGNVLCLPVDDFLLNLIPNQPIS